ncbi:hypothetical protein COCOBI_16-4610 [Coccomyxa sp. Obi]|nr:hypothetical protein COCOBI_16-4610 [Coccomyxa sp. Obi]
MQPFGHGPVTDAAASAQLWPTLLRPYHGGLWTAYAPTEKRPVSVPGYAIGFVRVWGQDLRWSIKEGRSDPLYTLKEELTGLSHEGATPAAALTALRISLEDERGIPVGGTKYSAPAIFAQGLSYVVWRRAHLVDSSDGAKQLKCDSQSDRQPGLLQYINQYLHPLSEEVTLSRVRARLAKQLFSEEYPFQWSLGGSDETGIRLEHKRDPAAWRSKETHNLMWSAFVVGHEYSHESGHVKDISSPLTSTGQLLDLLGICETFRICEGINDKEAYGAFAEARDGLFCGRDTSRY